MQEQVVKARRVRWHVAALNAPSPLAPPAAVLESAKWISLDPPASATKPVTMTEPFGPTAAFWGVSGCRNPGVSISDEVARSMGSDFKAAVTWTCARLVVS